MHDRHAQPLGLLRLLLKGSCGIDHRPMENSFPAQKWLHRTTTSQPQATQVGGFRLFPHIPDHNGQSSMRLELSHFRNLESLPWGNSGAQQWEPEIGKKTRQENCPGHTGALFPGHQLSGSLQGSE